MPPCWFRSADGFVDTAIQCLAGTLEFDRQAFAVTQQAGQMFGRLRIASKLVPR